MDSDGSELVIVWYQNEFGPPTDNDVATQLRRIDWTAAARDFSY